MNSLSEALLGLLVLGFGSAVVSAQSADAGAAEQQYRVARRLAAEASPKAAAALQRVIDLDPKGSLADDALVEQALLEGIPRWPEELGRVGPEAAQRAHTLLSRVLTEFAQADRAAEARLLASLLRLEPMPDREASSARLDLLAVANLGAGDPSATARYVLGWLDEQQGDTDRAGAVYQRLIVDFPESPATKRAQVGLARLALRERRFGAAARWLQGAIEQGVPEATGASGLRELAVRSLLRTRGIGGGWGRATGSRASTGIRNFAGMARSPDGGVLLADRRNGLVKKLDSDGQAVGEWSLGNVQAVTVDGLGRAFAAAGLRIYRLDPDEAVPVASQGSFAPVSGIAADSAGRLWVVDRRGTRVGRIDLEASEPSDLWAAGQSRVSLMVWDGRRLVAVDARSGKLFEIGEDGGERVISDGTGLQKPVSMAADPAGQLAVLDARSASVVLFDANGTVLERHACEQYGIARPAALAMGLDGSLDLVDGSTQLWTRLP